MNSWWCLPNDLAADVFGRLGCAPPETIADVGELVERIGTRVSRGTTAKIRAIEAGQRPPGEDATAVAEAWLADPHVSWTCWAVSALTASLINTGPLHAEIFGMRRTDGRSPPVDVHSVVAVSDDVDRWICDPHFGVGPVPAGGGRFTRSGVQAAMQTDPDGRLECSFTVSSLPGDLSYRSLTGPLDPADVAMFCDVSVTHSGLTPRPSATVLLRDGLASLRAESWTDPPELRLWRGSTIDADEYEVQFPESWEVGMGALLAAG